MKRRDVLHRLVGVAILLGAGASTLLHREVWLAHASEPATGLEAALALLTFAMASFGLLLVIGGAKPRDGWVRDCDRATRRREQRAKPGEDIPEDVEAENRRIMAAAMDPMAFAGCRTALATYLIMRARQTAPQAQPPSKTTTEKYEPGAYQ